MTSSSVSESTIEDFTWVMNDKLTKDDKLNYLQYPLSKWMKIVFNPSVYAFTDEGVYYQTIVNKILSDEVFNGFNFFGEKNGIIKIDLKKSYNLDLSILKKKGINPDFFVHEIPKEKFLKLLELRNYMFISKINIPEHIQIISIIGEIKSSKKSFKKKKIQLKDYLNYIKLANEKLTKEMLILMLIYDESYNIFVNQKKTQSKSTQIIYGYVPKLYYEDCYKAYNELIDQIKPKINKIDIQNKQFKNKISKKKLIKKLETKNKILSILSLIILLLSFIIFLIYFYYFNNKI